MGRDAQCFFMEKTGKVTIKLRRYTRGGGECSHISNYGYHNAELKLDGEFDDIDNNLDTLDPGETKYGITHDDPRWPTHCACGMKFEDDVPKQVFDEDLYRKVGTDELFTIRNAPHGAMWYAEHYGKYPHYCGPDGKALIVKCWANHDWHVDGKASNCTMPDDNVHKCWVRHGDPRTGNITVDKNGHTCQAGGGSIWVNMHGNDPSKQWHGFLRNGRLEEC